MGLGKMVDVLDKHGRCVCKVGPTVTSIGASAKAGFDVHKAIRMGRMVWEQKGDAYAVEKRNTNFGSAGYQG